MKVIFYGTAGAVQSAEDVNVSFGVVGEKGSVLVDASGNPAQSLLKSGITAAALDALVLTHAHPDHLYALPSLIHNLWLMKRSRPLTILCNSTTETRAKQLIDVFSLFSRKGMFPFEWNPMDEGIFDGIPGMRVSLFPVNHPVAASGVKIETTASALVYSADTGPCERLVEAAAGANALIHEATGGSRSEVALNADGHSSGRQAGMCAQRAGVETLFLCHFDYATGLPVEEIEQEARTAFGGRVIVPEHFKTYKI